MVVRFVCFSAFFPALVCVGGCAALPTRDADPPFAECYASGLTAFAEGRTVEAERLFKLALKANPFHAYSHYYLGVLYAGREEDDLAIVGFERALELEPALPEALHNLGTLWAKRGQNVKAIRLLEAAIEGDPDCAASYVNLGKAYYQIGLLEMAGAAFEEALARDAENPVALENLALLAAAAGDEKAAEGYRQSARPRP